MDCAHPRPVAVRSLFAALALMLGGCVLYLDGEATDGPDDDVVEPTQCFADTDCLLAGDTCCDCPSFALPVSSGWAEGCANADCMMPPGEAAACPPLVARCDFGACVADCAPVVCDMTCSLGFVSDGTTGCLTCACNAMPVPATCMVDEDCVEVP